LLAEPQAAQITVGEAMIEDECDTPAETRVRQPDLVDVIVAVIINIPTGVAGNAAYAWLRDWLRSRVDAAQVRVQEVSSTPAGDSKSSTSS
jgi:hypothetical protein